MPSYVDGTQGILIFLGIFWELKPTFALFKIKIRLHLLKIIAITTFTIIYVFLLKNKK